MLAIISTYIFLQVLCGHDKPVTCVALSVDLDIAVSGSEDGTVNIYTVKEGYYMKTIIPPGETLNPKYWLNYWRDSKGRLAHIEQL